MPKTFLIGDTHFRHNNIISYCDRPFNSVEEMDATLIYNWNKTVKPEDIVYFLGDFALCPRSQLPNYLSALNGNITFIRGNHDKKGDAVHWELSKEIEYRGYRFLLIHNPALIPKAHYGWTIHGHTHNNEMEQYPFIHPLKRTINVSVELIDYTPFDFDRLFEWGFPKLNRMEKLEVE